MFREDVIRIMQEELSLSIKTVNTSTVNISVKVAGHELKGNYVLSARRGGGDSMMMVLAKKNTKPKENEE